MEEKHISLVMTTCWYLSDFTCDWITSYHEGLFVAYPDCSLLHFCGDYQYFLDMAWWIQYEFVVVLCAYYFVCWRISKSESQIFGATTAVIFEFQF